MGRWGRAALAAACACACLRAGAEPSAFFEVEALPFSVAEDFSLPMRALQAAGPADAAADSGRVELGSVSARNAVELSELRRGADGRARFKIAVGYKDVALRVASELEALRDACPWREVLAHERGHAGIYRARAEALPALVRAALSEELAREPYAGSDADKRRVAAVAMAQARAVAADNEAFDSPAEYARLDASCGGALVREARRAMGDGR